MMAERSGDVNASEARILDQLEIHPALMSSS
jgi:hypothetical protein